MEDVNNRAVLFGQYIAEKECTVRDAAKHFSLGKSTVHKYVTERLKNVDFELYEKVRKILDYNLSVRHLRGGEATRRKSEQKQAQN